jgi:hypothetical protein
MLLVQSIGRSEQIGFNVDLFLSPRRGMFGNIRYGYARSMNDADDALTPPPLGTFATEWASARGESRHRFNWNIGGQIGPPSWGLNGSINGRVSSGTPYNITTGRDDNRDALFNDRPLGVGRNTLRGEAIVATDSRISWLIHGRPINASVPFSAPASARARIPASFGAASPERRAFQSREGGQRGPGGGGQGPRGPGGPGGRGPGQQNQGKRLEMYVSVQNLFNRVNYSSYVGVMTSPYFGRPTSAQAARRMELGWRFSF